MFLAPFIACAEHNGLTFSVKRKKNAPGFAAILHT